ncbi:arsenate reductase [Litchfieldella qijiaojingensis]|uniref:Arsenate reductase n=1 Tax=Litchfieldella qijiaojingensis TaxID=980347 RepID=A0ABQ2YBF2_9GAMM|nr:arsenate reductase family protein [Halomonas qijiaojingensis]GGX78871.1 arsenate reductase [Halomonas qijiaojingensis]
MTRLTLYHNPRCSKSRQALALLEAQGVEFQVHRYLETPLDLPALETLLQRLDGGLQQLLRTSEAEWKTLNVSPDDPQGVLAAIAEYPKLMQRPILDRGDRAIVGRPPEAILSLLTD